MAVFIIFAMALFVRSYRLGLFPLNHDEVNWALSSVDHFDKFLGLPVAAFNGYIRPFLSYFIFFTKKIFSSPVYAVRIPAVLIGIATVILIYHLAKEMYGKKAGIVSALLLSFLPWHVIQSRDGREMVATPFFGCLIALALFKSSKKRNNTWFILLLAFLALGSFYAYQVSILFIPIFLTVLVALRKDFDWVKLKVKLLGILTFFTIMFPLIYLQAMERIPQYLNKYYWYYYNDGAFTFKESLMPFLTKWIGNLRNTGPIALETLFFASRGRMLYGACLESPLLITNLTIFIVLTSVAISLWRRKIADKIVLIWLVIGYLGVVSGVGFFLPRYLVIIMVPLLILMGRLIAEVFNYAGKIPAVKGRLLNFAGIFICLGLVFAEILQLGHYYRIGPAHLEMCRRNSYGCKEAADYLNQIADIKNCRIIADNRMTLNAYLDYPVPYRAKETERECTYYVVWAPESHPSDYWDGILNQLYTIFRQRYPNAEPIKTIHYPNGLAAIHIFKIKENI